MPETPNAALADRDALEFLVSQSDAPEESRSSYWEQERQTFSVDAQGHVQGRTVMGLNTGQDPWPKRSLHWTLQSPFRAMGAKYPDHGRLQALGRLISARQGRPYWLDAIRQVLSLSLILKHVSLQDRGAATLVIGDGFGLMTSLVLLAFPERRVITVNLTKSLLLDLVNVRKAVPDIGLALPRSPDELAATLDNPQARLIAVRADDAKIIAGAPIDLAINIASMQEMTLPVVAQYFDILRSSTSDRIAFYCCNRIQKQHYDGPGPNFHDYPWRDGDQILVEGKSPWNQLYYNKTPPFWHYRRGAHRVVWQRLALLEKATPQ